MFLPIVLKDKDGEYIEHLNITHITRTSFVNVMNPDAGTKIHLRTGEVLTTPAPMDIVQTQIDECYRSAAAMIMFNILAEKAQLSKITDDVDTLDGLQPVHHLLMKLNLDLVVNLVCNNNNHNHFGFHHLRLLLYQSQSQLVLVPSFVNSLEICLAK